MSTFAFMKSIRFAILLTLLILPSLCHAQDWGMDPEWESMMRVYVKQSFNLEGKVYGTDQYEPNPYPLQGANIRMNCVADTTLMDGMAAGKDGEFWVSLWSRSRLKDTRVHIIISYLGMEPLDTIVQPEKKVEEVQEEQIKVIVIPETLTIKDLSCFSCLDLCYYASCLPYRHLEHSR